MRSTGFEKNCLPCKEFWRNWKTSTPSGPRGARLKRRRENNLTPYSLRSPVVPSTLIRGKRKTPRTQRVMGHQSSSPPPRPTRITQLGQQRTVEVNRAAVLSRHRADREAPGWSRPRASPFCVVLLRDDLNVKFTDVIETSGTAKNHNELLEKCESQGWQDRRVGLASDRAGSQVGIDKKRPPSR